MISYKLLRLYLQALCGVVAKNCVFVIVGNTSDMYSLFSMV